MLISEVARAAGVGVPTMRFYERRGLVEPQERTATGYRRYTVDSVRRVRAIQGAQRLGFSLAEVQRLLSLGELEAVRGKDVRQFVAGKIDEIDAKIQQLTQVRAALVTLAADGVGDGDCPVIAALAPAEEEATTRRG